ncbi:MAG TPA: HlyD family efflux transporter periplasmic adaptor subunit, partial [Polyangiaceae bacterium]|nr:HlyD family efflux transporter periplasmic adaptor subunit [Polyangiaceae bacterium]
MRAVLSNDTIYSFGVSKKLRWAMLTLALCAAPACGSKAAAKRPVFQGVVEHDERVIAFATSGRVHSVEVRRGEAVEDGRVLAMLDDQLAALACRARRNDEATMRAELSLLEAGTRAEDRAALVAEVEAARTQEELARKTKARAQSLHLSNSVGQADVDRADSEFARATFHRESLEQRLRAALRGARREELERARTRVDAAAAAVALEEERLAQHVARAVGPGRVVDIHVKPGEFSAVGAAAITIADTKHPYVEVFVPQGELTGIQLGSMAEVRVDAEASAFRGAVEYIAPKTEFTPRYLFSEQERPYLVVRVRVGIEDPNEQLNAG